MTAAQTSKPQTAVPPRSRLTGNALLGALLVFCLPVIAAASPLMISEFMADNTHTLADEDGDYSDWVEVFNSSTNTVDLLNWCLTDNASKPTKWRFPSTNLAPNQFLVVFASGKDRRAPGRPLHTSFKLSASGSCLALIEPDGLTVATQFSPKYPAQLPDISYGFGFQLGASTLVSTNAVGRLLLPTTGAVDATWMWPGFDDAGWRMATNGLGYETGVSDHAPAVLQVLASGPIAYWRLNETSGTNAANLGTLGNGANATYVGSVALAQAGLQPPTFPGYEPGNTAPRFGSGTSYVTAGQSLLNNRYAFTMSGWFKLLATPGAATGLWGQNDAVEFGFSNSGTLSVWTPYGGSVNATVSLATNTWHHAAVIGDGASLKIYLDGVLIAENLANTLDYGSSSYAFNIGGGGIWSPSGNQFNGLIDEVALYNRALTADEVLQQYKAGLGGIAGLDYITSLHPAGWWRLNETNGTTAANSGSLGAAANAAYINSVTLGAAGLRPPTQAGFETNNQAAHFAGTNRVDEAANLAELNAALFTVSCWARPTGGSGERSVVSSRDYNTTAPVARGYILAVSSSAWRFYIADTNGFKTLAGPTATNNVWTLLTGTFDGSTARFYVNGSLVSTAHVNQFVANTTRPFRLAYGTTSGSGYFTGDVDEVLVFQRALAANEVALLYSTALTGYLPTAATNFYYTSFVRTDLHSAMFGVSSSAYFRAPFAVPNPADAAQIKLRLRSNDGYVAYLNGHQVAAANAPASPAWNATAVSERTAAQSALALEVDLSADRGWLVPGTNLLALHGLNLTATNGDFLLNCELESTSQGLGLTAARYFSAPTPGALNGTGSADVGPILGTVACVPALPAQPAPTDSILVNASVAPAFAPVASVTLNWRVMFSALNQTPMLDDGLHGDGAAGDGVYGALIPAGMATSGQMIRWYITATDTGERGSRWPPFVSATDSEEYLGTVVADPGIQSALPVVQMFLANQTAADTQAGTRASLFYLGELYDNILMSVHGQSSSGWTKKSYNLDFNHDHRFLYRPGGVRQKDAKLMSNWGDKSRTHNALSHEFMARIGSAAHWDFQVRVQRNAQFWSVADLLEDADDNWLERLGLDPNGALYKIYDNLSGTGSAEKKTREWEDKSDLQALINSLNESLAISNRVVYAYDSLDLPQTISFFTAMALVSDQDHGHKNYYLYRNTLRSGEWGIMPWDVDLTWGRNWLQSQGYFTDTLFTDNCLNFYPGAAVQNKATNRLYSLMFTHPDFRRMYLRRLRTVLDQTLLPPGVPASNGPIETRIRQMVDLVDPPAIATSDADLDFAKWGYWGANLEMRPEAQRIIDLYLPGRRAWLASTNAVLNGDILPPSQPTNVLIGITRFDYNPVSHNQDEEFVCLTNANAFAVDLSGWRLGGGVDFTFKLGTVMPANSALYASPNQAAFRARSLAPRGGAGLYVTGPYSGHLSARGESVVLADDTGRLVATNGYPGTPSLAQQFLRITELMYHPAAPAGNTNDADEFEYVELKNISTNTALDLIGVTFTNGIRFTFTNSTPLGPGQFLLLVKNPGAFTDRYGTGLPIVGPYDGYLDNGGERVTLWDSVKEEILDFSYNDAWYPITDGLGFSLVVVDENAQTDAWSSKSNWRASGTVNGSPNRNDPLLAALPPIKINEALTHTDLPQVDTIELFNPTTSEVNIGGWFLTDDFAQPTKYRIPANTVVAALGFVTFDETQFNNQANPTNNFGLSSLGEEVWLFSGDARTNLTGYYHGFAFGPQANGATLGRHANSVGQESFVTEITNTLGAANAGPLVGPVIISEFMYHPPSLDGTNNSRDEFIELSNVSGQPTPLFDPLSATNTWSLAGAVGYTFPTNVTLGAGSNLLVVSFSPAADATSLAGFRAMYGLGTSTPIFGPYNGRLSNGSEAIRLMRPDMPELDGSVPQILVESITYGSIAPWPVNADGGGLSLHRTPSLAFGNDPASWHAAPPSPGLVLDGDNDRMPDWWEVSHRFDTSTNDAALDADGDGMSNGQEFIAGTDPRNAQSVLRLTAELTGGGAVLSFDGMANVGYTIQFSDSLTPPIWQRLADFPPPPTNQTLSVTNNSPVPRFYRVVTPHMP